MFYAYVFFKFHVYFDLIQPKIEQTKQYDLNKHL